MFAVTFSVAEAHAADFLDLVRQQAKNSLTSETDGQHFDVCMDPKQPGRVFLYEVYENRDAFDLHPATAHFQAFDAKAAPLCCRKPSRPGQSPDRSISCRSLPSKGISANLQRFE